MTTNNFIHYISFVARDSRASDGLLFFMNLSGLHTTGFRCNAMAVGSLDLNELACAGGLPMNLLLLLMAVGVVSAAVFNSGIGENNLEYLFRGTNEGLPLLNREAEVLLRGVAM